MSRMLRDAFNQRQKTDYGEMMPATEEQASTLVGSAGVFLAAAAGHVETWASANSD